MNKIISKAVGIIGMLTMPVLTLAQSDWEYDYNYDYNYDYTTTTDSGSAAGAAALGIGMIVIWGLAMLVGLAFFIFWIVMLIDCIKRQFEARSTWLAIMIVSIFVGLSWLAAILYFFMVKRKNLGSVPGAKPAAPAKP
ncbi:MAG: hypothetical protein WC752_04555 [Patescibacteria group bacterium]